MIAQPTPRGRPRDSRSHAAILAAASELVAETGYAAMPLGAVAARARVGKEHHLPPVVRRGRAGLRGGIHHHRHRPVPDTGTLEGDLTVLVRHLIDEFSAPAAAEALPGLLADFAAAPRAARHHPLRHPRARQRLAAVFDRARARGETVPGVRAIWCSTPSSAPSSSGWASSASPPTPDWLGASPGSPPRESRPGERMANGRGSPGDRDGPDPPRRRRARRAPPLLGSSLEAEPLRALHAVWHFATADLLSSGVPLTAAHHSGHARARLPGRHGTPDLGKRGGTGETPGPSSSPWRRFGDPWKLVVPGPRTCTDTEDDTTR